MISTERSKPQQKKIVTTVKKFLLGSYYWCLMHLLLLDAPFLVIPADYQGRPLVTDIANSGDATLQRYSISSEVARLEGVLRHLYAL